MVSVTAVMQKKAAGTWPLTVEIINDGETVKKASTSAEYGVVTVNYTGE